MDPIANANRIAMLLRQRLLERARTETQGKPSRATDRRMSARTGGVRSVESIEGLDDRRLKRALIESILADHFGSDLLNEAGFQDVVDRVTESIAADPEGAGLLNQAVSEIRK